MKITMLITLNIEYYRLFQLAPFEFGDFLIKPPGGGDFCAQHPTGSMTNLRLHPLRSRSISTLDISAWAVPKCASLGRGPILTCNK